MSETAPEPTTTAPADADVDPGTLPVADAAPDGQISGMAAPDDVQAV
jgi:hypothetical protein